MSERNTIKNTSKLKKKNVESQKNRKLNDTKRNQFQFSKRQKGQHFDWVMIGKLFQVFSTIPDVVYILNTTQRELNKKCKEEFNMTIKQFQEANYSVGRSSLRRAQYQTALKGNPTLLIWMGKQYLGQKENQTNQFDQVKFSVNYDFKNSQKDNQKKQ